MNLKYNFEEDDEPKTSTDIIYDLDKLEDDTECEKIHPNTIKSQLEDKAVKCYEDLTEACESQGIDLLNNPKHLLCFVDFILSHRYNSTCT